MVGVHIGLHLEDEAGHLVAVRADLLLARRLGPGRRGVARNGIDQFGDAEVLERRSKIDRRQIAVAEGFEVEFRIATARQLDLVGEALGDRGGVARTEIFTRGAFGAGDGIGREIEQALKLAPHANRPHLRADVERQHIGHLVQRLEGIAALAVDLIDEGDDRHAPQATYFEQLAGLRLDALGGVDHHHRRVHRGQRAIGIFREVLVARRVEQVEDDPVLLEGHHRGRDRYPALLFDLHPVRPRPPRLPARLDLAGQVDRAALQQQLLGERGLPRVRVRDDREGAAIGGHCGSRATRKPAKS